MKKFDDFLRFCEVRSNHSRLTLSLLSAAIITARAYRDSDLHVTLKLAGLAAMVAISIPLTYIPLVQVATNMKLQRDGRLHSATVIGHRVNQAGFTRWLVDVKVPDGVVRKWVHSTTKLVMFSKINVSLSSDLVLCRVETPGKSIWRQTLYFTALFLVSLGDIVESLYCLMLGLVESVKLLLDEGCSYMNIIMHILSAFVFGGAVLSNTYACFWRRRHTGLPSVYTFECITDVESAGGNGEIHALVA